MTGRPREKILYFAYGSNMLSSRLRDPSRVPSAKAVAVGYITSHRLTFDKHSEKDRSGKCDAEATKNARDRVYGVVFELDAAEKERLDRVEGLDHGYAEKPVRVITGSRAKQAVMYVADSKDSSLKPYH